MGRTLYVGVVEMDVVLLETTDGRLWQEVKGAQDDLTAERARADRLAETLTRAACAFRDYESQHKAKGSEVGDAKALVNARRAEECEEALAEHRKARGEG